MKHIIYIVLMVTVLACEKYKPNDLLPERHVDVTINLNLPQYVDLLVPSGSANTPSSQEYGFQGILLYNKGGNYLAYERACPHLNLNECTAMTFDGLLLKCSCDNSTFNIFSGGKSQTEGIDYSAREYHVQKINSSTLRITSY